MGRRPVALGADGGGDRLINGRHGLGHFQTGGRPTGDGLRDGACRSRGVHAGTSH
jgi:hypothetical protein